MPKKIVLGGTGMLGRALVERLELAGHEVLSVGSRQVDLTNRNDTFSLFSKIDPEDEVYHCAGLVGGIGANARNHYDFLYENVAMAINVVTLAKSRGVKRLTYVSSSCVYPRLCSQPMSASMLGTGPLEPTNEGYALAKIVGTKMCEFATREHGLSYTTVAPCNLYGPRDDFSDGGHVLASIVRKVVDARDAGLDEVYLWGDGSPMREFMHVWDAADAIYNLSEHIVEGSLKPGLMNVGSGDEHTVLHISEMVKKEARYAGVIKFDPSKPNGMPRKLVKCPELEAIGWTSHISLYWGGVNEMVRQYETIKRSRPL